LTQLPLHHNLCVRNSSTKQDKASNSSFTKAITSVTCFFVFQDENVELKQYSQSHLYCFMFVLYAIGGWFERRWQQWSELTDSFIANMCGLEVCDVCDDGQVVDLTNYGIRTVVVHEIDVHLKIFTVIKVLPFYVSWIVASVNALNIQHIHIFLPCNTSLHVFITNYVYTRIKSLHNN